MANAEIARRVKMAPSAVLERVRKLEDRGVVRGYTARLCPHEMGCGLLAFVFVRTNMGTWQGEMGDNLAAFPEVQEVHHIAGEDCFLIKVRVKDTSALGVLLRERINALGGVESTRTTIVLESVKETGDIPLTHELEGRASRTEELSR